MAMKLRPYQSRLVSAVLKEIAAGTPEIVLAAAPGSGKTEMAFAVIRSALAGGVKRILVLAHGTTVLRKQFADRAKAEFGPGVVHEYVPIWEASHVALTKVKAKVIVALPQSLHRRDGLPRCDLVIVDEAHEFYDAPMATAVVKRTRARSALLLTGSPSRFIARGLPIHSMALHDVAKECPEAICDPAIELVASEYLIEHDRYNVRGEVKEGFRYAGADTKATLDRLLEKLVIHIPRRRGQAVLNWQIAFESLGKTIIACRSQALARQVRDYFRKRAVAAVVSTHEDDVGAEEVDRFKLDATLPLLIVVRRATLGFDFSELLNFVDMTGSINIDRVFQMFCRVVRPHPTGAKKLFVKMTARGRMEGYTRDVMNATLQLGRKQTFESFNGRNLDGIIIPSVADDSPAVDGDGGSSDPRKARLRALDARFLLTDFFETIENLDKDFSPYARTTLGDSRARLMINHPNWGDTQCAFAGCGRRVASGGLCKAHAAQRRRGWDLRALRPVSAKGLVPLCGFSGCGMPLKAKGLCGAHWLQEKKGEVLRPLRRFGRICSFVGCGRKHYAFGLCNAHNSQRRAGRGLHAIAMRSRTSVNIHG